MIFKIVKQQVNIISKSNLIRNFSNTESLLQQKAANSSLYALRKSTGYALNKCKEALEKNNGNVEQVNSLFTLKLCFLRFSSIILKIQAAKWLDEQAQKEGWTKAEKLKNRQTSQGTLALCLDKVQNRAAIIEVIFHIKISI